MIEAELGMATTLFGKLPEEYQDKLRRLHDAPSPEKWAECHGIVINASPMLTLWQALLAVDPEHTPLCGPHHGLDEQPVWQWCPKPEAIRQALCYATH